MSTKYLFVIGRKRTYFTNKWPSLLQPVQYTQSLKKCNYSSIDQEFLPVSMAQNTLEAIHHYCHLPWWTTIFVTCVSLRAVITLPLAIYQNKLITRIELLQPTLRELSEALKHRVTIEGRQQGWSAQVADKEFKKKLRRYTYDLYKTNGCNPIKLYTLPWAQIPLWIIISLALRNLSGTLRWQSKEGTTHTPHGDMSSEGILWFPDLTIPDTTGILPIFLGLANLANIELHALKRKSPTLKQRTITMIFRSFSLCMIVIAYKVPAAMSFYWGISAGFGLIQNILLKFPRIRRIFAIPKTPSEHEKPFHEIAAILSNRASKFLEIQRKDITKK